jgi:hypothetical protein
MNTRRTLLTAAAASLGGGAATLAAMPKRAAPSLWDPVLGEVPVCQGGITRAQYIEGTRREATTDAERDLDLLEKVGLLDGHLLIGRALLDANEQRLALPHFGHPVRELYSYLEPRIAQRRAAPFEAELTRLENLAQANERGQGFREAWQAVYGRLDVLRATVPTARGQNAKFLIEHVAMMVDATAGDYGESISRGRIVNVLEYHDSAGFLRYAIRVSEENKARAPGAFQSVLAELAWVQQNAYPQLLPPQRPPISISAVRDRAGRVRALAAQA